MEVKPISLSEMDRMILVSYKHFIEGLSHYLGDSYEIVLHSLEDFDHSVIKIINGYYTGRAEGAPITDLALNMLARIQRDPHKPEDIVYFSNNRKGEPMKSTTIPIHGEGGRIIGLVCMNYYLNTPFAEVIAAFTKPHEEEEHLPEIFSDSIDDLVSQTVQQVRTEVLANPSISSSNKNKEIVQILYERGVFSFKDSVSKCAKLLGISKNTVYMHLRNSK